MSFPCDDPEEGDEGYFEWVNGRRDYDFRPYVPEGPLSSCITGLIGFSVISLYYFFLGSLFYQGCIKKDPEPPTVSIQRDNYSGLERVLGDKK